jgi:phosphatidylinositol-4-phosphate 3-kinase
MAYDKYDPSPMSWSLSFSPLGFVEKVTTELSRSISQLIGIYCSSFCVDFQPANPPRSLSCVHAGLHSHLSFTVYAVHNIPEAWVHRWVVMSFSQKN